MNKSTYAAIVLLLYSYQVPVNDKIRKDKGDFRYKLRFPSKEKVIIFADTVATKFGLDPTTISHRTKLNVIDELIHDNIIESVKDVELGCVKTALEDDIYNAVRRKILYADGEN